VTVSGHEEIIVVGAGIIGACVAYALAERGAKVMVLTAESPARGTSAASLAWVNSANKAPEAYHRLSAQGSDAYSRLKERLGGDCGIHLDGALHWAESDSARAELQAQYERLRNWDYPVEWVSPEQVIRDLAPELRLDREIVRAILHMPNEGWIDAPLLISHLLNVVVQTGGEVRSSSRVSKVRAVSSGSVELVTTDGERYAAAAVVNAAGPDAERVAACAGLRLPLERVPGILLTTDRVPVHLKQVVRPPDLAFRPDGGGRVVVLTDWVPSEPPDQIVPEPSLPPLPAAAATLSKVARYLPAVAAGRVEAARLGVRPMPLDGLPMVGAHPGMPGFYVVVTHSGVTLGPVLGALVAEELVSGRPVATLSPYRPDRFL
jgi:glycine/D-amino acid oxidase-like deaminating enzyme